MPVCLYLLYRARSALTSWSGNKFLKDFEHVPKRVDSLNSLARMMAGSGKVLIALLFSFKFNFLSSFYVDCKYELSSKFPNKYDRHEVIFAIRRPEINLVKDYAETFSKTMNECRSEMKSTWDEKFGMEAAISNVVALREILLDYEVEEVLSTTAGDFVTAKANISTWENMFATNFRELIDISGIYPPIYRAARYELNEDVTSSVQAVFNVLENPILASDPCEAYSSAKYSLRKLDYDSESHVYIFGAKSYLDGVANMASIHGEFTPSPDNNSPSSM